MLKNMPMPISIQAVSKKAILLDKLENSLFILNPFKIFGVFYNKS